MFWTDQWIEGVILKNYFGRLFCLSNQKQSRVSEVGEWIGTRWTWKLEWRRELFEWEKELLQQLHNVLNKNEPMRGIEDKVIWKASKDGKFSVKSFISAAWAEKVEPLLEENVTKLIWQKVAPPRAEHVVWALLINKLKTGEQLLRRGIIDEENARCPFCMEEEESSKHLFFTCKYTWKVWMWCLEWWGVTGCLHADPIINIQQWSEMIGGKVSKKLWRSLFFAVTWTIWYYRNQCKFNAHLCEWPKIFEEVKLRLGFWSKAFNNNKEYTAWQVADQLDAVLERGGNRTKWK